MLGASYLYKDINNENHPTYYLMKNPFACLQLLSTDFHDPQKTWEALSEEQVRWHAIAAAREQTIGTRLFDLFEDDTSELRCTREQELGIICVEDGEFSAFLLRWMFLRLR